MTENIQDDDAFDDELLELLGGNEQKEQDKDDVRELLPKKIYISKGTLSKAYAICDIVNKLGKNAYEWHALPVASLSDPQHIIRNIYVAKDQEAEFGHIDVSGTQIGFATSEIDKFNEKYGTDYYIVGWFHSHGNCILIPSEEDNDNSRRVLDSMFHNTARYTLKKLNLIEKELQQNAKAGKVIVTGKSLGDAEIHHIFPDEDTFIEILMRHGVKHDGDDKVAVDREAFLADIISAVGLQTFENKKFGFGFSVIINDKKDTPYGEIGYVEETLITGNRKHGKSFKVDVEEVDIDDDVTFKKKNLEKIVKERIKFKTRANYGYEDYFPVGGWQQTTGGIYAPGAIRPAIRRHGSTKVYPAKTANPSGSTYFVRPKPQNIAKRADNKILYDNLVNLFVLNALEYIARHDSPRCKYSEYMDKILCQLYNRGIYCNTKEGGLTDAVISVGKIWEDPSPVSVPSTEPYYMTVISRRIYENLDGEFKEQEIALMLDFKEKRLEEQNDIISSFVNSVLLSALKYAEDEFTVVSGTHPESIDSKIIQLPVTMPQTSPSTSNAQASNALESKYDYMRGDKVRVVAAIGAKYGGKENEYYFGDFIEDVPLGSLGDVLYTDQSAGDNHQRVYVSMNDGTYAFRHDELLNYSLLTRYEEELGVDISFKIGDKVIPQTEQNFKEGIGEIVDVADKQITVMHDGTLVQYNSYLHELEYARLPDRIQTQLF